MKKLIKILLLLAIPVALSSCGEPERIKDKIHELAPYVFEVDTYKSIDYDAADKFWATNNDNWGGGCSAVTKMMDINGEQHRIIGRNMDLNISNKCAYIVRTNIGNRKTVGLSYTFRDYSSDYLEVQEKGITKEFYDLLPFLCDDVLNDAGLHIEVNMRHGEHYPSGEDMFALEHSDPLDYEGKRRIHMFELPRYIGENCSTVEEAKEYLDTLDIYSKKEYWNYCFIISDISGASSLLEFNEIGLAPLFGLDEVKRVNWIDDTPESLANLGSYLSTGPTGAPTPIEINALAQTNFYLNRYAFTFQDIKTGEGRFITLQKGINSVNTKQNMFDLMNKISYSNFYKEFSYCMKNHFDPRTENVGEGPGLVYNVLFDSDPVMQKYIQFYFNAYTASVNLNYPTRKDKRNANKFWETTFCEVVDCMDKVISVRIFEEDSFFCNVGLEKTEPYSLY